MAKMALSGICGLSCGCIRPHTRRAGGSPETTTGQLPLRGAARRGTAPGNKRRASFCNVMAVELRNATRKILHLSVARVFARTDAIHVALIPPLRNKRSLVYAHEPGGMGGGGNFFSLATGSLLEGKVFPSLFRTIGVS